MLKFHVCHIYLYTYIFIYLLLTSCTCMRAHNSITHRDNVCIRRTGRDIRAKMHSTKEVIFGTCITSTSPHMAAAVRVIPGLDFVFIDTEHIPIGRETLAWMCRTYRSEQAGLTCKIMLSSNLHIHQLLLVTPQEHGPSAIGTHTYS